jgi:hypothetical protein
VVNLKTTAATVAAAIGLEGPLCPPGAIPDRVRRSIPGTWVISHQEVSAFTHAFKRWTGKTPREARSEPEPGV